MSQSPVRQLVVAALGMGAIGIGAAVAIASSPGSFEGRNEQYPQTSAASAARPRATPTEVPTRVPASADSGTGPASGVPVPASPGTPRPSPTAPRIRPGFTN
jgi:hypothetical protein